MPGISVSRGPKPLELCQGASYQCRAFHLQKKVGGFKDIGFSKLLSCLTWHDGGHSRVCVSIERKSPASWHHMSSAHSRFVERQIPAKINYYHSISQVLYSSPTRTINVFPYLYCLGSLFHPNLPASQDVESIRAQAAATLLKAAEDGTLQKVLSSQSVDQAGNQRVLDDFLGDFLGIVVICWWFFCVFFLVVSFDAPKSIQKKLTFVG